MDNSVDESNLDKFLTIGEASKLLGMTYKTTHRYVAKGDLKGTKKGGRYLIPRKEVEKFRRKLGGLERKSIPPWRFSPEGHALINTSIEAKLRAGVTENEFIRALERVKRSEEYSFPGTIARYVLGEEEEPRAVEILLIWRQSSMPAPDEIEAALAVLGKALAPVLDWENKHTRTRRVWMHT